MSNEQRHRLLMIVAVAAVGLLMADKLVLTPLATLWKERAVRIRSVSAKVSQGDALLKREGLLQRRWGEMRQRSLNPNQSQAENDVLSRVDRWSRDSGVNITSYTPQWRSDAEDHSRIDVRLGGTTSMEALVRFVHLLDQKELPLRLDLLNLSSRDKTGSELGFEIRFSGLMLKGGGE